MKIGIDARMYGPKFTGIGRYTYELIQHLSKIDPDHDYVVFMRKDEFESFTPPSSRFTKVLAPFNHYSFSEQTSFLKLLNSYSLDLMHFTHFNAPIFYKRPFVVTIHDLTLSFFPGKKMTSPLRRMAYHLVLSQVTRRARKIMAVSEHTKKDLMKVLGISPDRIEVVYNGVNPEFAELPSTSRPDLMKKLGLSKPYFLYTGVWRDHKNVVGMIKAFAAFNQSTGLQYQLAITGRENPTYREIPDTIRDLGLEGQVHLVGMVSDTDLIALYRYAFCYVFPSFYEGFGLPPLEAMQCKVPVIASNTSAIPEVCGKAALYFDPYNLKDMEDKMRKITADPLLRQSLIDEGARQVQKYHWNEMATQVLRVYNQALHG